MKPLDIVDVKAGINAGRLYVAVKGGCLLLGDHITGESVRLSDIEVKPVVHARWIIKQMAGNIIALQCSKCENYDNPSKVRGNFCWNCGARMDGGPDDDS